MKSLAIEREFGSGGREIGMRVAKDEGIPYYDTELLIRAAEEYGISMSELEEYDEKRTGSFFYDLVMAASYTQGGSESKIYKLQYGVKETMKKLAAKGPAVFIGRCATEILKSEHNIVRVYIYSTSEEKKLRRIMHTERVPEAEAKKLMQKKDRERKNYFKFWTEKEWGDRKNYDMELNTGILSTEECSELLQYIMER